jgi:DedD protein
MDEGAKRRLVGAAVLVALLVIFVPMLVDDSDQGEGLGEPITVPGESDIDAAFDSEMPTVEDLDQTLGEDLTPPLPQPETHSAEPGPPAPADAGRSARLEPLSTPTPQQPEQPVAPPPERSSASPEPTAAGPKPVPSGATAWVVQVASLGSSSAAQKLQNELRGQGYPAFVEQALVNGKTYYRVRVGPEVDRGRADALAARLQDATSNKPLVQRYR